MSVLFKSIFLTICPVLERKNPETLVTDKTTICSFLADKDKSILRRQFLTWLSTVTEELSIFLRISYPSLNREKKYVAAPITPPLVIKANNEFNFDLRVLGWDFLRDSQILPSTRRPQPGGSDDV